MFSLCLIFLLVQGNIDCVDVSCSGCITGYHYKEYSCLDICPTGYIQNTSPNTCVASSSQDLFLIRFASSLILTESIIDNFSHPRGERFNNPNELSPLPTKDRGFYFANTSSLVSIQNWVLAPDFSLKFSIILLGDGVIFEAISGEITYFQLKFESGELLASWNLTSASFSKVFSVSAGYYSSSWTEISLFSKQEDGNLTISLNGFTKTLIGFEFRSQVPDLIFYIGASNRTSFTGFLNSIHGVNSDKSWYSSIPPIVDCGSNQYFDTSCQDCTGCLQTWPWCVRNDCSVCYSINCTDCYGYSYSQCTQCNNSNIAPDCDLGVNCLTGSYVFNCDTCVSGFTLIEGLCLVYPYGFISVGDTTPVINIVFNSFEQYYGGFLQSGSNKDNWAPDNSPDTDDPYPAKNRGLYFDGVSMFLQSTTDFVMNYQCTVAFWIKPLSYESFFFNSNFYVSAQGFAYIILQNPQETLTFSTDQYLWWYGHWTFNTYSIEFTSQTTVITQSYNTYVSQVLSINGFALYDYGGLLYIGKSNTYHPDMFKGFLYSFIFWQTIITDFSNHYDICGNGEIDQCIWGCKIDEYYNDYEQICLKCADECATGCSTWGTCQKCVDMKCDYCTSYNEVCVETIIDPCAAGYFLSPLGNCCNSLCLECYAGNFFDCLSCHDPSYLLGQVCVNTCPLGYMLSGSACIEYLSPCILLTLDKIQDIVIDSISGIHFGTGTGTEFYPSMTIYDPIPTMQRGYFFNQTSVMESGDFRLSYNFTMVFYVKLLNGGVLFTKGDLSMNTDSMIFEITSIITQNFSISPSTDWMIMSLTVHTDVYGIIHAILSFSSGELSEIITENQIFIDTYSPLIFGSITDSFTGFLYLFTLFNSKTDISDSNIIVCNSTYFTECLWDCEINSFFNHTSCETCHSSCGNSCRDNNNCNLCEDPHCLICTDYSANCFECYDQYDLNSSTSTCIVNFTCEENYLMVNDICECSNGYYMENDICKTCNSSCLTCSQREFYECLTCEDFLLGNVCVDHCPIGFDGKNNLCKWESQDFVVVEYVFNTLQGLFYDKIRNVPAITGISDSCYPDLDETDPIPAYARGVYFTGKGSFISFPFPHTSTRLLNSFFSIAIWIRPSSITGTILDKSNSEVSLFSVTLSNLFLLMQILLDNTYCITTIAYPLKQYYWNHLLVSVNYNLNTETILIVNTQSHSYSCLKYAPFVDTTGTPMLIGSSILNTDFLQGFIYSLTIFAFIPSVTTLISTNCNSCEICDNSNICLPNCNITMYSEINSINCTECLLECDIGCQNSYNCLLCSDPNCLACKNFELKTCSMCAENYELVNSQCSECPNTTFFNLTTKKCDYCKGLCVTCRSDSICTSCVENSSIQKNVCRCEVGYSGTILCIRNLFAAWITLDSNNDATVIFSEALEKNLTKSDILVMINEEYQTYELLLTDYFTAIIKVDFQKNIAKGDRLVIIFVSELVSFDNSLLSTRNLTIGLYPEAYNDIISKVEQSKYYAQVAVRVGISAVLGTSFLNLNPNSFFQFVNNIEIYAASTMYAIDNNPILLTFLTQLQFFSNVPNLYSCAINENKGVKIAGRLSNSGNNTNLLLLNSGNKLNILIVMLLIPVVVYLLRQLKIQKITFLLEKISEKFKYRAFLRFWIQSFLEILLNASISVLMSQFTNMIQIIDFMISCMLLVKFI